MTPGAGMRRAQASAAGSLPLALAHGTAGPTFWSTRPLGLFPLCFQLAASGSASRLSSSCCWGWGEVAAGAALCW